MPMMSRPRGETPRRSYLTHQTDAPLANAFPRFTLSEFLDTNNASMDRYRKGETAFVVEGMMDNWPIREKWGNGDFLARTYPRAVTDFFPYNMLDENDKPLYLYRLGYAHRMLLDPLFPSDQGTQKAFSGKYLHWQVMPKQWRTMRSGGDVSPFPKWLKTDNWWMSRCLKTDALKEEYHIKTHWRVVLMGTKGSGMFNHTDSLRSSSWHAHVRGGKWWYVCRDGTCYEEVLREGDVLFYSKNWWHQTQCEPGDESDVTITLTGTVVNAYNYVDLSRMLHGECVRGQLGFKFSASLCDALESCVEMWHNRYGDGSSPSLREIWRPWRGVVRASVLKEKESDEALGNNYDGRNPIHPA